MANEITELFGIKYPIIQGGMVWCSGWELASAVSNNGGLGLLGAGSMYPQILKEHIQKTKSATNKPFGVNLPLLYPEIEKHIDTIIAEKVPIVFTSAGNPAKYTSILKNKGIIVAHVIANTKFALKCEQVGVDAIVAEGFEAGGHNGREETTTMALVPSIQKLTNLPLIAAGGIASGASMLAAMALGADGVQIGSRFAVSTESSAHIEFKKLVTSLKDGDTKLELKQLAPVRLIKNQFYNKVDSAQQQNASIDELKQILGKGRAKKGIFEGDLTEGELEIGQASAYIDAILPVSEIFSEIIGEYESLINDMKSKTSQFSF